MMSEELKLRMAETATLPAAEPLPRPEATIAPNDDVDVFEKMDRQQKLDQAEESEPKAWLGGALGALGGAVALGITAAVAGLFIKWLTIGIGFTAAFGVRRLGKGSSKRFGVIGATWAFVGCVVAYHVALCFSLAREQGVSVIDFVRSVESWTDVVVGVMRPTDFAIYAAAMTAGYRFSYTGVADEY